MHGPGQGSGARFSDGKFGGNEGAGVGVLDSTAQIFFFAKNATQCLRHASAYWQRWSTTEKVLLP